MTLFRPRPTFSFFASSCIPSCKLGRKGASTATDGVLTSVCQVGFLIPSGYIQNIY